MRGGEGRWGFCGEGRLGGRWEVAKCRFFGVCKGWKVGRGSRGEVWGGGRGEVWGGGGEVGRWEELHSTLERRFFLIWSLFFFSLNGTLLFFFFEREAAGKPRFWGFTCFQTSSIWIYRGPEMNRRVDGGPKAEKLAAVPASLKDS